MATNELFDSGIKVTGSFSAAGAFPVDGKFIVESIAERDDHDTQNRSYEGMLVYVKEDSKTYQKTKDGWKEFGFDAAKFEGSLYDGLDSNSTILALTANQGKILNTKITNHETNIEKHITSQERATWNAKASTDVATSKFNGLMSSIDKKKLDGIAEGATKYIHPSTHPATMITQDTTHRFVSDAEKATWNAKAGTKDDLGLGNVTNDAQVKRSEMGVPNGVATLDQDGKVPAAQLPSYVDDVLEFDTKDVFPVKGEEGKIYFDKSTNISYRWTGSTYAKMASDLALGETASTAYYGDKGKAVTEEVNKIKSGVTVVPKAADATTITGFTVGVNVPANAKFTDTVYNPVTQDANGLMIASDKKKLDGIADNANNYVHPNDSSTRHVTDAQIANWDAKAGTEVATQSANGLMSKEDKTKLNGIADNANNYVHPNDSSTRHVSDEEKAKWNAKAENTVVTVTLNGLMSAEDKKKLDSVEQGANNYVHPNDSSTRHVTDAQIATWDAKAGTEVATTIKNGLMSKTDKTKLDKLQIASIENMKYLMTAEEFVDKQKVKIPVVNITSESNITIGLDYSSVTTQQYDAAGLAKFVSKIVDGGIEVSCFGKLPEVDIPVLLSIVRKP